MSQKCVSEEEIREGKSRDDICFPDMQLFDGKTSWGALRTPRREVPGFWRKETPLSFSVIERKWKEEMRRDETLSLRSQLPN
ncbi:hypothetical protein E2C01_051578 [Portunus trituberculatus]|uniref:Uncharacterized protein n=1 Tax=Portunus trituberculatus TaxID=210409 RepID=A0A5B7GM55_PORTR|nr:hypothetical protein [Portunus trituberculatus]